MDMFMLLAALLIAAIFFLVFLIATSARSSSYPYEAAGPLLTAAERFFYSTLEQVIPSGYVVTFKVRIGDVLKVRKGLEKKQALIMRGKIQQKHFDFVVCRKDDMSVACCIELNDASHKRADRAKRDAFVRAACQAANVTLLEVKNSRSYVIDDLRSLVLAAIAGKPTPAPVVAPEPTPVGTMGKQVYPPKMDSTPEPSKISTSKMAKKHGCSTDEFMQKLVDSMYVEKIGDEYRLTEFGVNMGGEEKAHPKFGKFLAWPEDLPVV